MEELMIDLSGSTMFLPFQFLWLFPWYILECWLYITLIQRYDFINIVYLFSLSGALFSVGVNSSYLQDGDSTPGTPIPLSSEHVTEEGIYLLEDGEDCLVYIGNLVDRETLQQLFGISSVDEIPAQVSLYYLELSCTLNMHIVIIFSLGLESLDLRTISRKWLIDILGSLWIYLKYIQGIIWYI